ncbi:spore coat protein [Ornithinibacillus californiensis]|uniref:spore coat protein n=1 Tax=Ornithinibacillus californiensis TaxID=161536 RepID=UPI00064DB5B9|nr:spore coat protein [Ornithinibacillus californiensis]
MKGLPAIDIGLMIEHLSTHEGMIKKLEIYRMKVRSEELKDTIDLQIKVMRAHVEVMLSLINPQNDDYVEVPDLRNASLNNYQTAIDEHVGYNDKWIALEAKASTKMISGENYTAALMMKDNNVRNAHVEMALQQLEIQKKYSEFIKRMGWELTLGISNKKQELAYQFYNQV